SPAASPPPCSSFATSCSADCRRACSSPWRVSISSTLARVSSDILAFALISFSAVSACALIWSLILSSAAFSFSGVSISVFLCGVDEWVPKRFGVKRLHGRRVTRLAFGGIALTAASGIAHAGLEFADQLHGLGLRHAGGAQGGLETAHRGRAGLAAVLLHLVGRQELIREAL